MAREETLTGWLTRDEATTSSQKGKLAVFDEFPERVGKHTYHGVVMHGYWAPKDAETKVAELPDTMFPELTWTDEPKYVKLTIEVLD